MFDFLMMTEQIGWTYLWLILAIGFLVCELATVGLTTIWMMGGALAAMIVSALGAPVWLQIVVFFVVTFVLLYFTRPWAMKYLNRKKNATNYETILGIYCTYKGQLGMYPISLLLGGNGAEMATQLGRDNSAIPKKLGSEFMIRKTDDGKVSVSVVRRGAKILDVEMELGSYNHPLTHVLYQAPAAGKETAGSGYYFHFDRLPDDEGKWRFTNTCLIRNVVKYLYDSWTPGYVTKLELNSSIDDPWGCLPINTIVGGAYAENNLLITALQKLEDVDADELMPMIMPAWYDRTTFMETGRR